MRADYYAAVAHRGAVYCEGCLPGDIEREETFPIFANSEWDHYPVCDLCGEVHDYVMLIERRASCREPAAG